MKLVFTLLVSFFVWAVSSTSIAAGGVVTFNAYATTNVTTGAYLTLIASTATAATTLYVCDTSGKFIKLAMGKAGSEVDITNLPVSSCDLIETGSLLPAGTRLSIRAMDANATTGGISVGLAR